MCCGERRIMSASCSSLADSVSWPQSCIMTSATMRINASSSRTSITAISTQLSGHSAASVIALPRIRHNQMQLAFGDKVPWRPAFLPGAERAAERMARFRAINGRPGAPAGSRRSREVDALHANLALGFPPTRAFSPVIVRPLSRLSRLRFPGKVEPENVSEVAALRQLVARRRPCVAEHEVTQMSTR